jgi:signal transduction histidine kinase
LFFQQSHDKNVREYRSRKDFLKASCKNMVLFTSEKFYIHPPNQKPDPVVGKSSARHFLRTLIVGEDQFILSHSQYKRILLTGQLCFIAIVICFSYMIVDLISGISYAVPYELTCAGFAFFSFLLNRQRRFTAAKILLAVTANATVFLFAASEPIATGIYMYFVTTSLGVLVVFGYEERYKGMSFVILSMALFFLSMTYRFSFAPENIFTEDYTRLNLLFNFLGSGWASVCIIFFLLSINHRWEAALERNEKELKQKNIDLTTLNADLDRFVYSTSHDLRSPLRSMRGLIHLAQITPSVEESKLLVNEMKSRVDHLEKFIQDIADYSRNRTQEISLHPVRLKKLLNEVLDSLRYFPGASEMLVNVEVNDNLVLAIDSTRLEVILSNLLSNAIKYRDLERERSFVMIRMEYVDDCLIITIEDNGIGIPKEYLDKIFDMYVRAHDHSQGSGLGLFILKETVERLGGTFRVESKVRQGSSFIVTLPATKVDDAANEVESLRA